MPLSPEAKVPLKPLTTWKIGGPAEWFVAPESEAALIEAVEWAGAGNLPVHVLGRGSNVLIPDEGLKGLVICLRKLRSTESDFLPRSQAAGDGFFDVAAGVSLPRLSREIAALGYTGYEFYIGIPGTVGGAVVMNAGFGPGDERQTANRCVAVKVLEADGCIAWHSYSDFHPVYRHTDLLEGGEIVLGARFQLTTGASPGAIRAETARHLAMRKTKQPLTRPTAGSVFKGTRDGIPAAVHIDQCGLKGYRIGGAVVSKKHANWIENTGQASAADVRQLIRHIQEVVGQKTGIHLEPEVRFLH